MRHSDRQTSSRRGSASVFVLVVVVLMSSLLLARARNTVAQHRQTRNEELHLQTTKLADAGLQIARQAWRSSAEPFQLEWEVEPGTIHQTNSGQVTIVTEASGLCTVIAAYPSNQDLTFRVTRTQEFSQ